MVDEVIDDEDDLTDEFPEGDEKEPIFDVIMEVTGLVGNMRVLSVTYSTRGSGHTTHSWSLDEKILANDKTGISTPAGTKGKIIDLKSPIENLAFIGAIFEGVTVVRWLMWNQVDHDLFPPPVLLGVGTRDGKVTAV